MVKITQVTAFIAASALSVAAVDVCFYSNTLGCSGTAGCCNNLAVNLCCGPAASGLGFSIKYIGLPDITTGQAWSGDRCSPASTGIRTFQNGPGDRCWTGGGLRAASGAWTFGTGGRVANSSNTTSTECQGFNAFKYSDAQGIEQTIQIGGGGPSFEELQALYVAGNLSALDALKDN
ncbi:hypothetical protein CVT24_007526 [Panaeolus cyanescens]|uniref:Uncharacterized protein n=1 Tax=Panaeolus cyanescens TaxID=181874 RepID=A0A409YL31_9AGAR|nr:hypothetical protein CVT24_007526 [Panaeolus cyanescens]